MKTTVITAMIVLIFVTMSGIAIAEDNQHGMMSSDCPDCVDYIDDMDAMENLPFAQFDAMVAIATSGVVIEEKWAYGKRNYAPNGVEHVCWDFEEGSNMYPLRNMYPNVAVFENVSNSRCCFPACSDINEPSYVRKGANCGPRCRCVMHIYPYNTKFPNGTEMPYISALTGNAAFSPRVEVGAMRCYYPACSAFIGFKEDTQFVSFLASTHGTLRVRLYDHKGNYLSDTNIPVNTKREGDAPPDFTRFSIHLPGKEIGYMTLSGPFNGWNIDDLIVGGEPGYLNKPVDYSDVARLAEELHGVRYLEYGVGHDYLIFEYLDPWQFGDGIDEKYWNPETKTFELGEGIGNAGMIVWAYNKVSKELYDESIVKHCTVAKMEKHDFKVDVDPANTQPGDVCFMDRKDRNGDYGSDGYADEVYMVVEENPYGDDLIYSCPDDNIGVIYSKKSTVESSPAFMGYKRLPGVIKGGKDPIPKGH